MRFGNGRTGCEVKMMDPIIFRCSQYVSYSRVPELYSSSISLTWHKMVRGKLVQALEPNIELWGDTNWMDEAMRLEQIKSLYPVILPNRSLVNDLGCWVYDLIFSHWPITETQRRFFETAILQLSCILHHAHNKPVVMPLAMLLQQSRRRNIAIIISSLSQRIRHRCQ